MYSPRTLFLVPGVILLAFGVFASLLVFANVKTGNATLDAHTLSTRTFV